MPLNRQPTLQHADVRLRPLHPDDFEALYAVAADPLVWAQHPNPTRYQREVFQTFFAGALESGGAFLIEDAQTGQPIGSTRFYDLSADEESVLIGYSFLARSYWGGPTNRAVKTLLLDHALASGVEEVFFHVGAHNRRSQRAMEKLGAEKVEERKVAYHGEPAKLNFIYRIRRADWLAQPQP
ncbi:MAG: GNAT family N-acetyltransferase [Hymenobacteraceae bacterium]|nr:GNAT family N-acetyltransferase [Hymenobacteraceae bacterium]